MRRATVSRSFLRLAACIVFAAAPLAAQAGLAPDSAEQGVAGAAMKVKPAQPPIDEVIVRGKHDEDAAKKAYHEEVFRRLDLVYGAEKARAAASVAGFSPDNNGMGAAGATPIQERASSTLAAIRSAPRSEASKAVLGD
jgi:hypothetical protein